MCWQDVTKNTLKRDECAAHMCTHKPGCPHCKFVELELQVKLWEQAHWMCPQIPHNKRTADRLLRLIIRLEEKKEPAVDSVESAAESDDEWDDTEYINRDFDQGGEEAAAPEDDHAPATDLRISTYKKVSAYVYDLRALYFVWLIYERFILYG